MAIAWVLRDPRVTSALIGVSRLEQLEDAVRAVQSTRFTVEELAAMVAWLASEDCTFSTGAVYDISGGRATY